MIRAIRKGCLKTIWMFFRQPFKDGKQPENLVRAFCTHSTMQATLAAANLGFRKRLLKDIEDIRNLFENACEESIAKVIVYSK